MWKIRGFYLLFLLMKIFLSKACAPPRLYFCGILLYTEYPSNLNNNNNTLKTTHKGGLSFDVNMGYVPRARRNLDKARHVLLLGTHYVPLCQVTFRVLSQNVFSLTKYCKCKAFTFHFFKISTSEKKNLIISSSQL